MKKKVVLLVVLIGLTQAVVAREKKPEGARKNVSSGFTGGKVMADCPAPSASRELWVNNVRTIIFNGGDMWWDLFGSGNAYYIVPAVSNFNDGISSSFAGAIWIGGLDAGGQLKIAAMTYRQSGIDFWPGPLDTTNASVDEDVCKKYDKLFAVSREEVDKYLDGGPLTENIKNWPGNGDLSKKQALYLAPFIDNNGNGIYEPEQKEVPGFDIQNLAQKDNLGNCKTKLYGDYVLWWVYNDKGGIHSETEGVPIGVEIRAQAFAFKTNDEINDMTFYSYEVWNRSSFSLTKTYFTIWNDCDLGYFLDDYVGCDVSLGLGYIYNADGFDELKVFGVNGYGDFPPSLGCDFFRGPLADPNDGVDNDKDGIVDEMGETIQMAKFTYYNNNYGPFPPQTTNPQIAVHFYNFMTGFWKDGSPFTFGGTAYGGVSPVDYVYDGDPVSGTGWTETQAGNLPGDRRFLQSAGPFTLKPGSVNNVTFGMPWGRSIKKNDNLGSITIMKEADKKAQALFDNCFKLLDGPEAPDITIQELDKELIIYLTNRKGSNNYRVYNNDYKEIDISIPSDPNSPFPALRNPDKYYRFEGYIVYQVNSPNISSTDLQDRSKAVPIFQCDIKNGVTRLINYELDKNTNSYVGKVMVEGSDNGIVNSFRVTQDAFATTDNKALINQRTYYYVAVAYAYNNYFTYAPDVAPGDSTQTANYLGQKRPFLAGRKIKKASAIPHPIDIEFNGTGVNTYYGAGVKITRIEGQGNGGNNLKLTRESENQIVANYLVPEITYEAGRGPINIKVIDPVNIKPAQYQFRFVDYRTRNTPNLSKAISSFTGNPTNPANIRVPIVNTLKADSMSWELKDLTNNKVYYPNIVTNPGDSIAPINIGGEVIFPELGISVNVLQVPDPGETALNKFTNFALTPKDEYEGPLPNTFLGASIEYEDPSKQWLNPVKDVDGNSPNNWIRSGTSESSGQEDAVYGIGSTSSGTFSYAFYDPKKQFANILDGTWAPYPLCQGIFTVNSNRAFGGPAVNGNIYRFYYLQEGQGSNNVYNTISNSDLTPDQNNTDMRKLSSVLIVFTKDKSKWTRCPVLEMQEDRRLSSTASYFFEPKRKRSVDKNGNSTVAPNDTFPSTNPDHPNFISAFGMGWFPGYAINLETGERLNIAFGEDSYQSVNNGDDMMFNPTANSNSPYPFAFGGKHFIYVFGNSMEGNIVDHIGTFPEFNGEPMGANRYDHGERIYKTLQKFFLRLRNKTTTALTGANPSPLLSVIRDIMWVSMPLVKSGYEFKNPENMLSDVRIQINVSKPYRYGYAGMIRTTGQNLINNKTQHASATSGLNRLFAIYSYTHLPSYVSSNPLNNNFPLYRFNTFDLAADKDNQNIAKNALDKIKVVPNPYYAYSKYENNRIENRVRITNLPNKCTIRIYTLNGTLVRTIKRDVSNLEDLYSRPGNGFKGANDLPAAVSGNDINTPLRTPYVDWDLKNDYNIPITSGLYIFHIDAPGIGEKTLKWFCVMRPLDLQNY